MTDHGKSIFMSIAFSALTTTAPAPAAETTQVSNSVIAKSTVQKGSCSSGRITEDGRKQHREILERKAALEGTLHNVFTTDESKVLSEAELRKQTENAGKKATGCPADLRRDARDVQQIERAILNYSKSLTVSRV